VRRLLQPKLGRRRCSMRRRGQVPARPNFRDGPGRFSVSARDKKPRLSGASVADRGTPDPSVAGRRVGRLRCSLPPLPSPGSLVGVQTARLFPASVHSSCPLSCTIRAPCRRVMRAAGRDIRPRRARAFPSIADHTCGRRTTVCNRENAVPTAKHRQALVYPKLRSFHFQNRSRSHEHPQMIAMAAMNIIE
jgi:hypothetical protein